MQTLMPELCGSVCFDTGEGWFSPIGVGVFSVSGVMHRGFTSHRFRNWGLSGYTLSARLLPCTVSSTRKVCPTLALTLPVFIGTACGRDNPSL